MVMVATSQRDISFSWCVRVCVSLLGCRRQDPVYTTYITLQEQES